jgi:hypothetical protein
LVEIPWTGNLFIGVLVGRIAKPTVSEKRNGAIFEAKTSCRVKIDRMEAICRISGGEPLKSGNRDYLKSGKTPRPLPGSAFFMGD